jgi:hypothetical protein
MDNQLERYRADAIETVEQFRRRYHEDGNKELYVGIAQRWSEALQRNELDPNELSEVIRDAERYRFQADVSFFGFINSMRKTYHRLWEQCLTSGEAAGEDAAAKDRLPYD